MTRSANALAHLPEDVREDLIDDANPPRDAYWPAKDFGARMTRGVARVTVEGDLDYSGEPVPRYFYRGIEIVDADDGSLAKWEVTAGGLARFCTLKEARERIDSRLLK
jgi:hypothetical protein